MAETGDPIEHSIYDGEGNEIKVVTTRDEEGRTAQGTGETTEEALEDAKKPGDRLGEGYSPGTH
ncbi:MAG: hypothetical protein ACRDZ9_07965 [Acidimicrobiales bacterium]